MVAVDPEVLQLRLPLLQPKALDGQRDLRRRAGHVVVVIVPGEDGRPPRVAAGERPDVGLLAHALLHHRVEVDGAVARRPATRFAPIRLIMRNTLKTGRLMPLVASARNPAK